MKTVRTLGAILCASLTAVFAEDPYRHRLFGDKRAQQKERKQDPGKRGYGIAVHGVILKNRKPMDGKEKQDSTKREYRRQ